MRPPIPDDRIRTRDAQQALERFRELLSRRTREVEFQRLFTEAPFILSRTLPLRLLPSDIRPLGRPGRSEPDFIAFPSAATPSASYGIIELKRPDTRILNSRRKGSLILSSSAETAISQARLYRPNLPSRPITEERLLMLGNRQHIFVIIGLGSELAEKVGSELAEAHLMERLPPGCHLIPYDTLCSAFAATVPPTVMVLVPALDHADLNTFLALLEANKPQWKQDNGWWAMSDQAFEFWYGIEANANRLFAETTHFIDHEPFLIFGDPKLGIATESDNFYGFNWQVNDLLGWIRERVAARRRT